MDFTPRGNRPVNQEQPVQQQTMSQPNSFREEKNMNKGFSLDFGKLASVFMLVCSALVAAGVIGLLVFGSGNRTSTEGSNVNTDKYQAVFLTGGQVYFGKIVRFNSSFVALSDIYYLRVNQQVQPGQQQTANDISLTKLGNELHGPEDLMFINRDQVQFWENLKDDGQVVKAIKAYIANPDAATSQQTNTNSTTPTTTNTTTTTTPTTNKTTTTTPTTNR
jgi:hypothetical protein